MPVMRRVTLVVMYGDVENHQLQAYTLRGSCRESHDSQDKFPKQGARWTPDKNASIPQWDLELALVQHPAPKTDV